MDFNYNGFSANMGTGSNDNNEAVLKNALKGTDTKRILTIVLGIAALVVAFLLIPYGILAAFGSELFSSVFPSSASTYLSIHITSVAVLSILSAALAAVNIFLCVNYLEKKVSTPGGVLALIAFAVNFIGVVYNVVMILVN